MHTVIATGGKQYRISQGDVIRVEKLDKLRHRKNYFKQMGHQPAYTESASGLSWPKGRRGA